MSRPAKYNLPPRELPETLGQTITRIRKLRGFTQEELARRIGIERHNVTDYENDKMRMFSEIVARFALALEVTADEILGLTSTLGTQVDEPSLRLVRKLMKVEKLPPHKRNAIVQTLDMILKGAGIEEEDI